MGYASIHMFFIVSYLVCRIVLYAARPDHVLDVFTWLSKCFELGFEVNELELTAAGRCVVNIHCELNVIHLGRITRARGEDCSGWWELTNPITIIISTYISSYQVVYTNIGLNGAKQIRQTFKHMHVYTANYRRTARAMNGCVRT